MLLNQQSPTGESRSDDLLSERNFTILNTESLSDQPDLLLLSFLSQSRRNKRDLPSSPQLPTNKSLLLSDMDLVDKSLTDQEFLRPLTFKSTLLEVLLHNLNSDKLLQLHNLNSDKPLQLHNQNSDKLLHNLNSDKLHNLNSDKLLHNLNSDKLLHNLNSDKLHNLNSDKPHNLNSDKLLHNLNSDKLLHNLNSDKLLHNLNSDKLPHNLNSDKPLLLHDHKDPFN
jgi:hypothetical protein